MIAAGSFGICGLETDPAALNSSTPGACFGKLVAPMSERGIKKLAVQLEIEFLAVRHSTCPRVSIVGVIVAVTQPVAIARRLEDDQGGVLLVKSGGDPRHGDAVNGSEGKIDPRRQILVVPVNQQPDLTGEILGAPTFDISDLRRHEDVDLAGQRRQLLFGRVSGRVGAARESSNDRSDGSPTSVEASFEDSPK
jgi:hypothetical protein